MEKENERFRLDELNEDLLVLLATPIYTLGAYTIDVQKKLLTLNSESIRLTKKELYLLIYFADNISTSMIRKDILNTIWKVDTYSNSRSLDVYVCKIRKLLSKDSNIVIVNIHSKGYRIIVD